MEMEQTLGEVGGIVGIAGVAQDRTKGICMLWHNKKNRRSVASG